MKNSSVWTVVIVVIVALVLCCCCVVALGAAGVILYNRTSTGVDISINNTPVPFPVEPFTPVNPTKPVGPTGPGISTTEVPALPTPTDLTGANATLNTLENAVVPNNDLLDLAKRLQGKENIPQTVPPPAVPFKVGDTQQFWVTNVDTNESFQVSTTLRYLGDHIYFWIEDGVKYSDKDLKKLGDTFDQHIYPTDREFFGSEWSPGVDGDPRLYIILAKNLGSNLAGYFSSTDEYSPEAHKYSNAHETFMLNADNVDLGDEFTYGVLAHEFQHMIHWYRDRNEESWLNEGFSELAAFLNGYGGKGGFDWVYSQNPDLQLNDWPNDPNATTPHYGAGFLFVTYFLDRFGEDATKAVVANPQNGMVSVDAVLVDIGAKDPVTGKQITADDVFGDWVDANFLNDPSVGDGRYTYHNYTDVPSFSETETVSSCPLSTQTRDVSQYGVDYIGIDCRGSYTLNFTGATQVGVLPEDAHSGKYAFWSNKGDESDMTLTQTFDFTNQSGPLSINYWTWYDLEKDYDYLYLEASVDGNQWEILKTPSGTDQDPSGNSYGWGYNGTSNGWIQETVDLSQFAGKSVTLRFEYVTDAAVNGEGLLLDDISIPEIGYQSDFENDNGGWDPAGFVRIENVLPQTFRLSLISKGKNTTVQTIELNSDQTASIPVQIGGDVNEVVLVVSGTTRFTRQTAQYQFSLQP